MSIATADPALYLPITIGTELLVEIPDFNVRTKSGLVGMRPGHYLIIGMSEAGIKTEVLKESQIIVRYLFRGSVYGFKTRALSQTYIPERLIFLSYPMKLEEYKVRNNTRYECILPAKTLVEGIDAESVVVDISLEGLRCIVKCALAEDSERLRAALDVNREVSLDVQLPGMEDMLRLSGAVRNVSKDDSRVVYGVMFGSLGDDVRQRLTAFVSLISEVKPK